MKKILAAGSVILLALSLTACGNSDSNNSSSSSSKSSISTSSHKVKKVNKSKESSSSSGSESSSSSKDSKNVSNGKTLKDFESAFNEKLGNDDAAKGVTVSGTKSNAKIIVQGPNSWNGVSTQSNKWFSIEEAVSNDFDSLAKQYGVNDSNATFTWKDGNGNVIVKD